MYNGIGLLTARGSGTSGYVQSNRFNLRGGAQSAAISRPADLAAPVGNSNKQPNQDILEHARKREVELKVAELEDQLDEDGMDPETILERTSELRQQLEAASAAALEPAPVVNSDKLSEESHEVAKRKLQQMAKLRGAFGLAEVKEGEAFDPEAMEARRNRERAARDEERAARDAERAARAKEQKERAERREAEVAKRAAIAQEEAQQVVQQRRDRQAAAEEERRVWQQRRQEQREGERRQRSSHRRNRSQSRSTSRSPRRPLKRLDTRGSPVPHDPRAASGSPERWAPDQSPVPRRERHQRQPHHSAADPPSRHAITDPSEDRHRGAEDRSQGRRASPPAHRRRSPPVAASDASRRPRNGGVHARGNRRRSLSSSSSSDSDSSSGTSSSSSSSSDASSASSASTSSSSPSSSNSARSEGPRQSHR